MKLFNILTAGVLLCAGLASCEMKDELKGSSEGSSDMGYLDLGVAVNASQNNVSRAGDVTDEGKNENVGVSIPTGDFPVIITNVDDPSNPIEYDKYDSFDQLKEENKDGVVALPVGTYTVTAHSNDVLETKMDVPYYEGTVEINITKDVTSGVEVKCTMKNTRIALSYDTEFIASFTDWTITVEDGTGTVLTFECTDSNDAEQLNPAPQYMWVAEGVSKLTVHASGHNTQGEYVTESRELTKPAGGNSPYWTGGDALTITMEENTPADPTGVQGSGITITADVEFEESDATIEVPVTPGESTEEPGGGEGDDNQDPEPPVTDNKPIVTLPQTTYTLPDDKDANADVLIQTALKEGSSDEHVGLKSVFVKIIPGNQGFTDALDLIKDMADFTGTGVELINNTTVEPLLQFIAPALKVPAPDAPSYTFPVGAFFETLMDFESPETTAEGHVFEIMVTDNNDNSLDEPIRLNVVVNKDKGIEQ